MSILELQAEKVTSIFEGYNVSYNIENFIRNYSIKFIKDKQPSTDKQIIKLLQEEATLAWILFGIYKETMLFV